MEYPIMVPCLDQFERLAHKLVHIITTTTSAIIILPVLAFAPPSFFHRITTVQLEPWW
jgi:hypothetical protein